MKKLLILSTCLWALGFNPTLAQTGGVETVVVTVDDYLTLRIIISRGPGQSEVVEVPLKDIRQHPTARQETLQREFNKLFEQGFALQGTYGGGATDRGGSFMGHSTLVFTKRQ